MIFMINRLYKFNDMINGNDVVINVQLLAYKLRNHESQMYAVNFDLFQEEYFGQITKSKYNIIQKIRYKRMKEKLNKIRNTLDNYGDMFISWRNILINNAYTSLDITQCAHLSMNTQFLKLTGFQIYARQLFNTHQQYIQFIVFMSKSIDLLDSRYIENKLYEQYSIVNKTINELNITINFLIEENKRLSEICLKQHKIH